MKTKLLTLITFLILSLNLSFDLVFAQNSAQEDSPYYDQTVIVTNYLDDLRDQCKFGVKEFEKMRDALSGDSPELINPMSKREALRSEYPREFIECHPYWENFNWIIDKLNKASEEYPRVVDLQKVHEKTEQLLFEITDNEYKREEAIGKTENINIEMDFATIPAGTYTSK